MRELNQEHIKKIIDFINKGPFFQLLSIKICELRLGYCRLEIDLDTKHLNSFGGLHGGVYASLIDSAAYWAVYCDLDENVGLISIDLKVDNLSTVKEGKLIVEGKRIKVGKTICLSEASVTDIKGKYLAHGTSKQMITQNLQSMNQVTLEYIPPKFIVK